MEQERPPVTIVDPRHPLPPPDVLEGGTEKPPFRPRRWQVVAAVAAVLAVAAAASLVQRVQASREDARLDRVSAQQVALGLTGFQNTQDDDEAIGSYPIGIRNDGPAGVQLLSLRFGTPGLLDVDLDAALPQYGVEDVDVLLGPCQDSAPESIAFAEVRVRTARGVEHTTRATIPGDVSEGLLAAVREHCGQLLPTEALISYVQSFTVRGGSITLPLHLEVRGPQPVLLTRLAVHPGLRLTRSPALPLRLEGNSEKELELTFTITDCEQLEGEQYADPVAFADATVTDADGRHEGTTTLWVGSSDGAGTEARSLFASCFPGVTFFD